MSSSIAHRSALEFLETAHLFRLGHLPTEQPHPGTRDLSMWARSELRFPGKKSETESHFKPMQDSPNNWADQAETLSFLR